MKRLMFKITLLSDVVVHADSATEGQRKALDFIPGSNFLGLVAQKYDQVDRPYDIFHSNKVRFGDAHLAFNNVRTVKAPLSWYVKKGEAIEAERWVHHYLNDENLVNLIKQEGIQLQQVRQGWIVPINSKNGKVVTLDKNFVIKSAYDRKRRRSADKKMYGYQSFASGTEWIFYVDIEEDIDENFIKSCLTGIKYIGKSRSAQYGKVKIEAIDASQPVLSLPGLIDDKYLIIYAESRLAFFNEFGQPTLRPTAAHFKLDNDWELDWSKSQIMSSLYAPYNFKNRTFLGDRAYFEKGSVFVFKSKNGGEYDVNEIVNGVGEFLNEGFGQVILNPIFLKASKETAKSLYGIEPYEWKGEPNRSMSFVKDSDPDFEDRFKKWLNQKEQEFDNEKFIYQRVSQFIAQNKNKFEGITPSQWGQVRSVAISSKNFEEMMDRLFEDVRPGAEDGVVRSHDRANSGLLMHGRSERNWKRGREILRRELSQVHEGKRLGLQYTAVLATQMLKEAKKIGEGK